MMSWDLLWIHAWTTILQQLEKFLKDVLGIHRFISASILSARQASDSHDERAIVE